MGLPLLGLFCAAPLGGCAATGANSANDRSVFATDFTADPREHGWSANKHRPSEDPQGQWHESGEGRGADGWLHMASGHWLGPAFEMSPEAFYRITVHCRTAERAYVAMRFYDEQGDEVPADFYTTLYPEGDPMAGPADEGGWHMQQVCLQGRERVATARVQLTPLGSALDVAAVRVERIDRQAALAWADHVYAQMPPVRFDPPTDRWRYLPKTEKVLREGGRLRVVMLGDSIVNDISNSMFARMIEREHPGVEIDLLRSVDGGHGASDYRKAGQVRKHVLDHKPDLLIIGGVSHRNHSDAYADVIEQVRAEQDPDILVMSGAVAQAVNSREVLQRRNQRFRERIEQIAADKAVAFFDLRAVYDRYIERTGGEPDWFMRDEVHANSRGKQVVGRILARYFQLDAAQAD